MGGAEGWFKIRKCRVTVRADSDAKLEDLAEARALLQAGPELLDACRKALSCMSPDDNDITAQALRAAIAKAEGRERPPNALEPEEREAFIRKQEGRTP